MKIIIRTMNNLPEHCWNCPFREEKDEKIAISEDQARQHSIKVPCDMCGKIVEHRYLAAINDNIHVCKDCEQWFTEHLTKREREELYTEVEEKIRVTKCNRCGKMVERKSLTTIVEIAHGGTSTVNYPHDGKFRICKDCERWLLTELAYGLHNQWAQNKKEAQK